MTTEEFNSSLKALRLSVYASAPVLGISLRQAQRYSAGDPVSTPVANYLSLLVRMVQRWKKRLKEVREQIAWVKRTGARMMLDRKDATPRFVADLRRREEEWLELLRDPGNGLPAQIDE
jgi:hypothetical protein